MMERLRELHAMDGAERIGWRMLRWIEDPLTPKTADGRLRINPILILPALLVLLAAGTFLFFSLVEP